jgi:hypothetical protein
MADDAMTDRERLEQLRDQFEVALASCSDNMLPQLASQYRATLADLAALPPAEGKSARERLADRVAAANVVA